MPTAAALIRSADIASNSSKAANIHNEWHTLLRTENPYGESDVELSGRKLRNKLLEVDGIDRGEIELLIQWKFNVRVSSLSPLFCCIFASSLVGNMLTAVPNLTLTSPHIHSFTLIIPTHRCWRLSRRS